MLLYNDYDGNLRWISGEIRKRPSIVEPVQ